MMGCKSLSRLLAVVVVIGLSGTSTADARVLFLLQADGATARPAFSVGSPMATTVTGSTDNVCPTTTGGRFGSALDLTQAKHHCAFDGLGNLDTRQGTISLWFQIKQDNVGKYHPLVGWYRPPWQPGNREREASIEVYVHNGNVVLGMYTPKPRSAVQQGPVELGKWYHLELNWDGRLGDGKGVYNVYLNGRRLIRFDDGGVLTGKGGRLHLGVWDYSYSRNTNGLIDEVVVTNRVEHLTDFQPPDRPQAKPGTIAAIKQGVEQLGTSLTLLQKESGRLAEFTGVGGQGRESDVLDRAAKAEGRAQSALAALTKRLKDDKPRFEELERDVDATHLLVQDARTDVGRVIQVAAARAAAEDRRSLLFKDLNETLAKNAVVISGTQLFPDNNLVASQQGLIRSWHRPVRSAANPVLRATGAWERGGLAPVAVEFDQSSRQLVMFYVARSSSDDTARWQLCRATSTNGVAWKKTASRREPGTNVVARLEAVSTPCLFRDPADPDASRRFKVIFQSGDIAQPETHLAYSADGVNWRNGSSKPVDVGEGLITSCGWDPGRRTYVALVGKPGLSGASVARMESPDMVHWTPQLPVVRHAALDRVLESRFVSFQAAKIGGHHLGWLGVRHANASRPVADDRRWRHREVVQMATSRDGFQWRRTVLSSTADVQRRRAADVVSGATWFGRAASGVDAWDSGGVQLFGPPVTVADRWYVLYAGLGGDNDDTGTRKSASKAVGLATLGRDRLVSLGTRSDGVLLTKPLIGIGDTLVINGEVDQGGEIRVEAMDALGRVVRGFAAKDCQPLTGDAVRHVVRWKAGAEANALQARSIQLRFHMRRARLFSFAFETRRHHFVPLSFRQE